MATAIEALCGRELPTADKAVLCQRAEHEFAGVPCGIMDQFAVTCGRAGHALLLDCRSQVLRHVSLADDVAILVVNSGVKHSLADGEYARRRAECERAATAIGVAALRDASEADLHAKASQLDAVALRRAIHVVSENARVIRFVEAIERHDWSAAGRLMQESHASLRDDYEVSCPELDQLVEIATTVPGVHGCRMTGGGFGGCVVAVVKRSHAVHAMQEIQALYRAATGIDAEAFLTSAAAGAHVRLGGTRR
jgi:galactokinase